MRAYVQAGDSFSRRHHALGAVTGEQMALLHCAIAGAASTMGRSTMGLARCKS
jgi:hypothetical protein